MEQAAQLLQLDPPAAVCGCRRFRQDRQAQLKPVHGGSGLEPPRGGGPDS